MAGKHPAAAGEPAEPVLALDDGDTRGHAQKVAWRCLQVGRRIDVGAENGDAVRYGLRLGREAGAFEIADVAVRLVLHPGPAVGILVDRNDIAVQENGQPRRVAVGRSEEQTSEHKSLMSIEYATIGMPNKT